MKKLFYLLVIALSATSCNKEADPIACMYVNSEYTVFDEALFENCSQDASTFLWSVEGDGTSLSHTAKTVSYTWETPGSFVVSLVATSESGELSDEVSQDVEVVDLCYSCIYIAQGPSSEEIICASSQGSIDGVHDRKQELNDLGYTCTEL